MAENPPLDLVVKNVQVIRPLQEGVERLDLGITGGKYARIAPQIPEEDAKRDL